MPMQPKLKTIIPLLTGALILLFSPGIQGQMLNQYLKEAAENNPGLQAAYHEYYAALEQVPQAGALPDPTLSFGYFISPVETRLGPQRLKVSLSQMFPWFGTLSQKQKAAAEQARVRYQEFLDQRNTLFKKVKIQWFRLYKTREALRITRENTAILQSLKQVSRQNYETGKSRMTDLLRIDVNIREQQNKLDDLRDRLSSEKTDFKLLLNREPGDTLMLPGKIRDDTFDTVALRDSIRSHPLMQALQNKETALAHQYEVNRKKGYPSFSLALDYAVVGERTDMQVNNSGRDVIMPMIGISIPLSRNKYQAMKKETELKIASVRSRQQEKLNNLSSRYTRQEEAYRKATRQIELYREQIKESERIYQLLKSRYSTDGENFFELLRTRLMVLEYQLKLEQARAERNIAVAKLEYLTHQTPAL